MIEYNEWKKVYDNSDIEIRLDPHELDGYGLRIKKTNKYLDLPRGTLRDIGESDRDTGMAMIYQLMPVVGDSSLNYIFEGTNLNLDSLVLAISEAHKVEEKRYEEFGKHYDK